MLSEWGLEVIIPNIRETCTFLLPFSFPLSAVGMCVVPEGDYDLAEREPDQSQIFDF